MCTDSTGCATHRGTGRSEPPIVDAQHHVWRRSDGTYLAPELHPDAAGGGLFRRIRHATAIDPAIGRSHTDLTEAMMGTMGHSFDAWLFHPQLGELLDMARALPEGTIVLDHLGAPLGVGPYAGRQAEARRATELPHGGRALVGPNQLVDRAVRTGPLHVRVGLPGRPGVAPLHVLWNALQNIATRYNDDEQDAMFSGTARRVYRLAR